MTEPAASTGPSYGEPTGVTCGEEGCPAADSGSVRTEYVFKPFPRYALSDFDRTIWGKLMQKIVDYLHRDGD
ncbi:hypothetical protein NX786_20195 [Telluria mixta]|uniref:Uncharacterized protein n=1 Tax=Telluria mixta TaxID=34071 RepID=A0ABT2C498_9BURK|nr:hypothetical protein [Telluria mixta]MCS0631651.1 hypothetical protein [Telluria mixta]WEM98402.1 hypothetical protein P0M04_12045 [Telluria mixta]